MGPGDLDQQIVIQQKTQTRRAEGGYDETWSTFATVWAKVRPLSGRERTQADAVEAPADYRFTIRRRTDITEAMRVTWGGGTFNIRFIGLTSARELYMDVDAERAVAT